MLRGLLGVLGELATTSTWRGIDGFVRVIIPKREKQTHYRTIVTVSERMTTSCVRVCFRPTSCCDSPAVFRVLSYICFSVCSVYTFHYIFPYNSLEVAPALFEALFFFHKEGMCVGSSMAGIVRGDEVFLSLDWIKRAHPSKPIHPHEIQKERSYKEMTSFFPVLDSKPRRSHDYETEGGKDRGASMTAVIMMGGSILSRKSHF